MENKSHLSPQQSQELITVLQQRFEANPGRHQGIEWAPIAQKLQKNAAALWSLHQMEETGGEPDVVSCDKTTSQHTFFDCAAESPAGRRNLCYDGAALASRKANKPRSSALDEAAAMGIQLLDEAQYRALQQLGPFDAKTSSWVITPQAVRKLGGALFGDRRYDHVFIYHNGAESYYGARGFRGALTL